MGQVEALAMKHGITVVGRGALRLVSRSDVERFFLACVEEGYAIVGFEGFYVTEKGVMPEMGAIADFSQRDESDVESLDVEGTVREARRVIESLPGGEELFFDFVLGGP